MLRNWLIILRNNRQRKRIENLSYLFYLDIAQHKEIVDDRFSLEKYSTNK